MSNYTHNVTAHTTARELPDLWSPFALNKYGPDNVFITPLNVRHNDSPYIGMCYTVDRSFISDYDDLGWTAVSGLTSRSSDIQAPNETIEGSALLGLEPGIYQCALVSTFNCDDCGDHEECDTDHVIGWSLMRVDDE